MSRGAQRARTRAEARVAWERPAGTSETSQRKGSKARKEGEWTMFETHSTLGGSRIGRQHLLQCTLHLNYYENGLYYVKLGIGTSRQ